MTPSTALSALTTLGTAILTGPVGRVLSVAGLAVGSSVAARMAEKSGLTDNLAQLGLDLLGNPRFVLVSGAEVPALEERTVQATVVQALPATHAAVVGQAQVAQVAAPVAQVVAPVAQVAAPVAQVAAPVAQVAAPVAQVAAPVVVPAPLSVGHAHGDCGCAKNPNKAEHCGACAVASATQEAVNTAGSIVPTGDAELADDPSDPRPDPNNQKYYTSNPNSPTLPFIKDSAKYAVDLANWARRYQLRLQARTNTADSVARTKAAAKQVLDATTASYNSRLAAAKSLMNRAKDTASQLIAQKKIDDLQAQLAAATQVQTNLGAQNTPQTQAYEQALLAAARQSPASVFQSFQQMAPQYYPPGYQPPYPGQFAQPVPPPVYQQPVPMQPQPYPQQLPWGAQVAPQIAPYQQPMIIPGSTQYDNVYMDQTQQGGGYDDGFGGDFDSLVAYSVSGSGVDVGIEDVFAVAGAAEDNQPYYGSLSVDAAGADDTEVFACNTCNLGG